MEKAAGGAAFQLLSRSFDRDRIPAASTLMRGPCGDYAPQFVHLV
jgi:hypothetical protein